MLHAAKIWEMTVATLNRLYSNDGSTDKVSPDSFLSKPGILDLDVVLYTSGMRLFGHAESSTAGLLKCTKLIAFASNRPGRSKKKLG